MCKSNKYLSHLKMINNNLYLSTQKAKKINSFATKMKYISFWFLVIIVS